MTLSDAKIDKLAYGGNGVCRIDGKVCFVPFSCPGDEVHLRITKQKKSYCSAEIVKVLQPSPERTVPVCPIFGDCGGCSWQHIQYPDQLKHKRQIFTEMFWRGGRVGGDLIRETVASTLEYGYRSRVQFKVSVNHGKLHIGFYRNGTHDVENAHNGCPVARPVINEILGCLRSILDGFSETEFIDQISIDAGEQGAVAVVHYTGKNLVKIRGLLLESATKMGSCTGLFLQSGKKQALEKVWGSDVIEYHMPQRIPGTKPFLLSYLPGGFSQINQVQNVAVLSIIRRLGDFKLTEKLLDLYCGNGNFSIPIAAEVASVVGIEGSEDSIRSANSNKACNAVQNVEFNCDDVKVALKRLVRDSCMFDVVLLDPPRAGAEEAVSDIAGLHPTKIIYISCDPSTLARDCGLLAGHGYRVVESVPLDMFPQTYHLESITLLIKQ